MWEDMLPLRMLGPLMLMLLLCDADSMCPTDLNPLTLDPAEVMGKYGEIITLNCSSVDEDHDGMYWRHGNVATDIEGEKSFVLSSVTLSDWNITAECRIKLDDTHECSKDLEITIYKNPEINMFPTKYVNTVVEGTLYELQCDVNVAPVQNLTVRWYKDNEITKTQTFNSTSKRPDDVSSTLTVNMSRGESGAQFRCEAHLDFGPYGKQSVTSEAHSVVVSYGPELKSKTVTDVSVDEGDDVTLNCEAEGNPPPVFRWTSDGVYITETSSELNITGVRGDSNYTCTATNHLGSITKHIHVYVREAIITPKASAPRGCPLILEPAEIVVRFGDPASVNCSTSATDVAGMGWEAAVGGTGFKNTSAITWTVEKLEDWTIEPKCFLTLDDKQCTRVVNVTLYKTPDTVSVTVLNDAGLMMEGTDYQLNCDIVNVAPVQKLKVKWYQGNKTLQTQSFSGTRVDPIHVTSTLTVTAQRDYNRALFRCEAELDLGPKGPEFVPTATSSPYVAHVLYKPLMQGCESHYPGVEHNFSLDMLPCQADGNPPPVVQWYHQGKPINASEPLTRNHSGKYTAEVVNDVGTSSISVDITIEYGPELKSKTVTDVSVDEGDDVTLNCEAEGNPPPVFDWTSDGVDITETSSELNITGVRGDSNYTCTATNHLGSITKHIHVYVREAIITPEASAPRGCPLILEPAEIVVRFGDPASVNCSTSATDVAGMGWEATVGGTGFENTSAITWTVEKLEDWTIEPTCFVTLDDKQCTRVVNVTLYKTPDTVSVTVLNDAGLMMEGTDYQLNCDIVNVAPVQKLKVKWYQGNKTLQTQSFSGTRVDPVHVTSTLTVTAQRDYNRALFRCEAELDLGPKGPEFVPTATSSPYVAHVRYKPLMQGCESHYSGVEHKFSLDMLPCQADGNPPPVVQWYHQGKPINASEPLTRNHSGKYTAEVVNDVGTSSISVDITIEYSPSFSCNDHYEVEAGDELQTKCEPEGIPQPTVTWFKDGQKIETPQRWTKQNSGKYSLTATNKHGTDNHTLSIDVVYAPVFNVGNKEEQVTEGANVTFECTAEGNPLPKIDWNYTRAENVWVASGGRSVNINIREATSTNAGVYNCVATNKVGSATRAFILMTKDKKKDTQPHTVIWLILLGICIMIIIVLLIYFHNSRKKHGQYSFAPVKTNDGSDIPMTTQSSGVKA